MTADVGGKLNIQTLQDVSIGSNEQSSGGVGVSPCIPPICYGSFVTVSASAAGANADGVYISTTTQAGIKAGDEGFNADVKGNTTLAGECSRNWQCCSQR